MTDAQFNEALKAYAERTKAVGYIGNTIAALATVIAFVGGGLLVCWWWSLRT